jgi:hypothetical protein
VRGSGPWLGWPGLDRRRVSEFVMHLTREDFGSVLVVRPRLLHPPLLLRGTRNCSAGQHTNWNINSAHFRSTTKYVAQSPYHYFQFLKGNSKHSHTFWSAITIPNPLAVFPFKWLSVAMLVRMITDYRATVSSDNYRFSHFLSARSL